eukprot:gene3671-343_t
MPPQPAVPPAADTGAGDARGSVAHTEMLGRVVKWAANLDTAGLQKVLDVMDALRPTFRVRRRRGRRGGARRSRVRVEREIPVDEPPD